VIVAEPKQLQRGGVAMKVLYLLLAVILFVAGLGLLYLTNIGFLSFRKPYVVRKSLDLQPENTMAAFVNMNVVPTDRERILENQTGAFKMGW
jgi:hypothetical protein